MSFVSTWELFTSVGSCHEQVNIPPLSRSPPGLLFSKIDSFTCRSGTLFYVHTSHTHARASQTFGSRTLKVALVTRNPYSDSDRAIGSTIPIFDQLSFLFFGDLSTLFSFFLHSYYFSTTSDIVRHHLHPTQKTGSSLLFPSPFCLFISPTPVNIWIFPL